MNRPRTTLIDPTGAFEAIKATASRRNKLFVAFAERSVSPDEQYILLNPALKLQPGKQDAPCLAATPILAEAAWPWQVVLYDGAPFAPLCE